MAALNIRGVPDELYEMIKEKAKEDQRSINQEIIWLLQKNLTGRGSDVDEVWTKIRRGRENIEKSERGFSDSVESIRKDRGR